MFRDWPFYKNLLCYIQLSLIL